MIGRIWSSLPTFKKVALQPYVNIVVADRDSKSDDTDSTNGLGKTTLLRVISFCLGSDLKKDRVLNHPELGNTVFGLELIVSGRRYPVERDTGDPEFVAIHRDLVNFKPSDFTSVSDELVRVTLTDWKALLSRIYYPCAGSEHPPGFRDLLNYKMRLGKDAYVEPLTAFRGQPGASKKFIVSFLLGLNWGRQLELTHNVSSRSHIRNITNAFKEAGAEVVRSVGELEAERASLDADIARKKAEIENFTVLEDYEDLQKKLAETDTRMHSLINDNHIDGQLKEYYKRSSRELPRESASRPLDILRDAGAIFRPEGLRSVEDVVDFHATVYRNRREFLASEIARLDGEIKDRTNIISMLSGQKTDILRLLAGAGALDDLIELQRGYTDLIARREALVAQIAERRRYERLDDELTTKIDHGRAVLRADLEERSAVLDEARQLFGDYMRILYGKVARLSVDVSTEGYMFRFTFDREGSDGVEQMVVFCFDLMLASIWARQKRGFMFLAHDSTMFADVDPRQVESALKLAADEAERTGFQYLCCLNAGSISNILGPEFNIQQKIRLRLTDDEVNGRLLGKTLPPREPKVAKKKAK